MIASLQASIDVMLDPFGKCRGPDSLRERVQELADESRADVLGPAIACGA